MFPTILWDPCVKGKLVKPHGKPILSNKIAMKIGYYPHFLVPNYDPYPQIHSLTIQQVNSFLSQDVLVRQPKRESIASNMA